ncbi:arylsulfatase A-like [Diadema setosum]|uniref:arylsulfatase A-like n=1 Tax=Diadema setosum TaxID=31175 RepID=UPI003B3B74A0
MTGRYQTRVGAYPLVFRPNSPGGLPLSEITIAEILEPRGYDTYMVGKWHLGIGREREFLPTKQGFHRYYGLPFSNDQCLYPVCTYPDQPCVYADEKVDTCASDDVAPCAVFSDDDIYIQTTDESDNAYARVHHESGDFTNSSRRGIFGNGLFELDAAVGDVMKTVQDAGQTENTLRFFLSDSCLYQKDGNRQTLSQCSKPVIDQQALQDDVNAFTGWCDRNKMSLNTSKTKVMRISWKRHPGHAQYYLNDTQLEEVYEIKYLGVIMNNRMSWDNHVGGNLKEYTLGGSSGPLKCGKFSTYEGGMRVPFIAHWPGQIQPGPSAELGSILDLLPTIASIAGAEVPSIPLDGYDLSEVLFSNNEVNFYMTKRGTDIHADG